MEGRDPPDEKQRHGGHHHRPHHGPGHTPLQQASPWQKFKGTEAPKTESEQPFFGLGWGPPSGFPPCVKGGAVMSPENRGPSRRGWQTDWAPSKPYDAFFQWEKLA